MRPWPRTILLYLISTSVGAAEVSFNRDVRPILADNCFKCHGPDPKTRKAKLRFDQDSASSRRAIASGELLCRITEDDPDARMPPLQTGKTLSAAQLAILKQWLAAGAEFEGHWAFIAPKQKRAPNVSNKDWPRNAIDHPILARLDNERLKPNPRAARDTLLRRLTLDLIGLPPTPAEVAEFQTAWRADPETAWANAIDRLLTAPHFGEKWARWWMDLAHYADTDGYTVDYDRPHAWRWRDWLINSLNRNQPFDQFTVEQIAGDVVPGSTIDQKIATGFFRHTLSNREGGADLEEHRVKKIIDRTGTYGATWLGLTIECAQCHDHKFDPVSHRDYYSLYAFFNNADAVNIDAPLPGEKERRDTALVEYRGKWHEIVTPIRPQLDSVMRKWERMMRESEREPGVDYRRDRALELLGILWGAGQGEGQLEGVRLARVPPAQRSQREQERLLEYFIARGRLGLETEFNELDKTKYRERLRELNKTLPGWSRPQVLEAAMFPRETHIFTRGDFRTPAAEVTAGTPAFLATVAAKRTGTQSRSDLARWTVSRANPLTARVLVNRIWQELFGQGLVATPADFGTQGKPPSHPELLDGLAVQFMDGGWDLKQLIRLMVNSATYRQSSEVKPEVLLRDPHNVLLARQSRLRLSAELVRDAALHVSGLGGAKMGGASVRPPQPEGVIEEASYNAKWKTSEGADRYRRGIYTWIQRVSPYAQFATFDLPNVNRSCSRRDRSNTPLQALTLLNDQVFVEAADALAIRILRETPAETLRERIRHGFQICLGRSPTEFELGRLTKFWNQRKRSLGMSAESDMSAWRSTAVVILNLDEFITRE
ncbi:MAG: hypothetical protein ACI91J_002487 [Yoonia sp.]|jgi:hypothetical protein